VTTSAFLSQWASYIVPNLTVGVIEVIGMLCGLSLLVGMTHQAVKGN
jgi:hypothetical protein